jgi:hypothetical protein
LGGVFDTKPTPSIVQVLMFCLPSTAKPSKELHLYGEVYNEAGFMSWCCMVWIPLSKSDRRSAITRERLESAINEVVKFHSDDFVSVIIQPVQPKSRSDPNWDVRGVRFGKADRDKSGRLLAAVVERMQREFALVDDKDEQAVP